MNNQSTLAQCEQRLNALFVDNHISPLPHMETRSDLLEWLQDNQQQWAPVIEQVEEILSDLLSQGHAKAFLMDIAIADGEHRKYLTEQLVKALIATGVPVKLVPKAIQEAAHATHPELPEDAIDPVPAFTYQGKVFLDQAAVDMDAPLHEYTHLWATALQVANPSEWRNVVALMRETELWEMVARHYPKHTQDQIAEEVLATFSGRRGTQRLKELGVSESHGFMAAIRTFWRAICDLFHVHFDNAEAVSDRILSDFVNEVNPLSLLQTKEEQAAYAQLNQTRRDNFIGVKGASTMDENNLFSARLECLRSAEQMEAKGRTPKEIKIATGWERGVDRLWRYEIVPFRFKPLSTVKAQWQRGFRLDDILDAPELFAAYPEIRDIPIKAKNERGVAASYCGGEGITVSLDKLFYKCNGAKYVPTDPYLQRGLSRVLAHELQHYIQDNENFAQGGNSNRLSDFYMIDKEKSLNPIERCAFLFVRELRFGDNHKSIYLNIDKKYVLDCLSDWKTTNVEVIEYQSSIKDVMTQIEAMSDSDFSQMKRLCYNNYSKYNRWRLQYTKDAGETYKRLAGEVEARNASKRITLTPAERMKSLLSETMDTPANQQYLYDNVHRPTLAFPAEADTSYTQRIGELTLFNDYSVALERPRPIKGRGR